MHDRPLPDAARRPNVGDTGRPTPADMPPLRVPVGEGPALTAAVDALGLSIVILDPDGIVEYASDAMGRLIGIPDGRILDQRVGTLLPGLEEGEPATLLMRALATGEPFDVRLDHSVGLARLILAVHASRTADGRLALELTNINESASSEQAPLSAIGASASRRQQSVPASAEEENALLRELAGRLADTADSATLMQELAGIARRECGAMGGGVASVRDGEVKMLATAGSGLPESGRVVPLRGSLAATVVDRRQLTRWRSNELANDHQMMIGEAAGQAMIAPLIACDRVVGVMVVVRDRSASPFTARDERRLQLVTDHAALALWGARLLEQALAVSEARGNFLATISHELRTPLTALVGYGELLADEILGSLSDGQKEMVERIRSVTYGLSGIVDELLSFSSLEDGRERLRMLDVDSSDLLQAALAVVEPSARQKGLRVRTVIPSQAPSLRTDPEKVRQILVNLAGNAVKFTDEGEICFALEHDVDEVRFLIQDTGPGIPSSAQERIFEPFTQLEEGLTRRHGGTGLGLYVASRLAGLLGGRIELASKPGEGSSFALALPRNADS